MTKLEVLTYPNKFLQQPTKPVENIDEVIERLVADMAETMYEAPGVGLAAIQVGSDKQVLVYDEKPAENDHRYGVIINPKVVETEGQIISENEGCLSVPDFRSDVKRAAGLSSKVWIGTVSPFGLKPTGSWRSCSSTKSII